MNTIPYHLAPNNWGDIWQRYIEHGISPGSFGAALLSNDLTAAVRRADHINREIIPAHVDWLWNHMIYEAWGSPEKYQAWCAAGGLEGRS